MVRNAKRIIIAMALCLVSTMAVMAQQNQPTEFATTQLQTAAKKLGIADFSKCKEGYNTVSYKGTKLVIQIKNGRVEGIGKKIFALKIREANPLPVYDYLEHAYMNQQYDLHENPFLFADIKFTKGSWKSFEQVNDSTPCNVGMTNDRLYNLAWKDAKGNDIVALTFPVDYEKLAITTRKELESNFIRDLKTYKHKAVSAPVLDANALETKDGKIWTLKGGTYLSNVINQDTYYYADRHKKMHTLWLVKNPMRSIRNLFCVNDPMFEGIKMEISFMMFDMTVQKVTVDVLDFVNFCREKGCEVFVGIETPTDDEVKASVFMYDRANGYDHIFPISVPFKSIGTKDCVIKARGNLYAPTTNVSSMSYDYVP